MDIGLLIDGHKRDASGAASYERMDPFTGKLATRAAASTSRATWTFDPAAWSAAMATPTTCLAELRACA